MQTLPAIERRQSSSFTLKLPEKLSDSGRSAQIGAYWHKSVGKVTGEAIQRLIPELSYLTVFAQLHPAISKRRGICLTASLMLHVLCLGWLLHNPTPVFVAPAAVTKGNGGSSVARIYFGGSTGVKQEHSTSHLSLPKPAKQEKAHRLAPLPEKKNVGNVTTAAARPEEQPGGSPYGSLSYGAIFGLEVRPALPVAAIDPVVEPDLLNGIIGDEVIEVTIDRDGNITEMKVLQSIGPLVDQRVLAALEKWHFAPATRNGVPIASKQDVHYHFPR